MPIKPGVYFGGNAESTYRTCDRDNCSMCRSRGMLLGLELRTERSLLTQLIILSELVRETGQVQQGCVEYLGKAD